LLIASSAKPSEFIFLTAELDEDTLKNKNIKDTSLVFEIEDRSTTKFEDSTKNQFDLNDPNNIKTVVDYNGEDSTYYLSEKIGESDYRNPTSMSYDEFMKYQASKNEELYWKKRANTLTQLTKKGGIVPKVNLGNALFDRIFGGSTIEVKPQGNVDMFFGLNAQNIKDPALIQSAQKYSIFDFNLNMNLNMLAKVGEKMKMNFAYNDKATFDFENQLKLEYTGQEDNIIKKIEAGNIAFPLKTTLIQGVQSLFGLKTQLQFGRLMVTSVASQQKSKKESFQIKNGAQTQQFAITSDNYDDFRHFFLAQQFRDNFNNALKNYPIINSLSNVTRLEVWITNRTGATENSRDIVALQDLGESKPYRPTYNKANNGLADNNANTLYTTILQQPNVRSVSSAFTTMENIGLKARNDFEKTAARKLNPSEYSINPQLGFISINTQLNPDDVLGIAYEYTFNGQVHQVGEFAQNLPPDTANPKVLFLKMLKSTSPDPTVPLWNLMMKNIYSLGASGVSREDFILNVFYQDPGGGEKRYLPEGPKSGIPLLNILNLDRLNNNNDPQPDGRFDFVENFTINSQQGRIMFPVLEPFGDDLKPALGGSIPLEKKYLYNLLYDSTKNIAGQFPQYNRFVIKGSFKATNSSEIYLGGFNIPQGSVIVNAGGQQLTENVDYTIDYGIGKLKIINSGILSSGIPINVSYENGATFGAQIQNFTGTRLDYFINDHVNFGSTLLRLSERPFFNKVNFGEDPIKNTVLGFDGSYQKTFPSVTHFLDKLPLLKTTAPSMMIGKGEVAALIPGHSKLINGISGKGEVYLDDFESTRSGYDLKFPVQSWNLSSTPQEAVDASGNILFPEASLTNNIDYGKNRARLAWYNIDPCLVDRKQTCIPAHLKKDIAQLSDHYLRLVQQRDVFPSKSVAAFQGNLTTFDLGYYPDEKGPYNLDDKNINPNGNLLNPTKRWAGITRPIDVSDFETSNIEFIEFWMLDPYIGRPTNPGGQFYINLGNVSEDILKDSKRFYENGLPSPPDPKKIDPTIWSNVPKFQQVITPAFDNSPTARAQQDVGFDGMDNAAEKIARASYLSSIKNVFGASSKAYIDAEADPDNDDFHHFQGEDFNNNQTRIFQRYRKYNNPEGNSPIATNNTAFSNSYTNNPETEDINKDNTLNENEQYFQYRVDIKPNMQVGTNFIVNKQTSNVPLANGTTAPETWYQFKIPITDYNSKVGAISDFKSIRFIRLFLTNFQDSAIMRFARLELGRNTWRRYNFSLKNPGELVPDVDNNATNFNLFSVSLEENSNKAPVPYVVPPGVAQQQQQVSNGSNVLLNEQALAMQVCNLEDGNAKGAYKSLGVDLRQFKEMRMFIHAENVVGSAPNKPGDVRAFIRIGSDFVSNYYEYQIPLTMSAPSNRDPLSVWPTANELNFTLQELVDIKNTRNKSNHPATIPFIRKNSIGNYIKIIGNPNLGEAKMAMVGVLNPTLTSDNQFDDGQKKCIEVWFNELRVSGLNETPGYAALGQIDMQLADIATVKMSGSMHTAGYGNIDQRLNQRLRDNYNEYAISTNITAGKLFPESWGVLLPLFAGYSQSASNPIYDPYDLDIKLKDKVKNFTGKQKDSVKSIAQDFTSIKSINVQNMHIAPKNDKRKQPWDLQNFDASYSYSQTIKHNPLIEKDNFDEHHASVGYTFAPKVKPIEPFKKLIPQKRKYFALIRDFNFNLLPSNFSLRQNIDRTLGTTKIRNIDDGAYLIPENYYKSFTWNRAYTLRWDLTKALSFDYSANNNSRVDEPFGLINTSEKKDTLLRNIRRLGRNTMFTHSLNASYNLPISKIPILDWTTIRTTYATSYNWNTASLLAQSLGNTIGNTQAKTVNGDFNFTSLYNKNKYLRILLSPKSKTNANNNKSKSISDIKGKVADKTKTEKKEESNKLSDRRKNKTEKDLKKEVETLNSNDKVTITTNDKTDKNRKDTSKKNSIVKNTPKKPVVKKKKKGFDPSVGVRFVARMLLMVKRANFSYSENLGTTLPGYMDSTQYGGMNWRNQLNPGADFVFGYQPTQDWLEAVGNRNLLSRDSLFTGQFQQQFSQTLNATINVEPFNDFRIDFTFNKTFSKNHSELYKDTVGGGNEYSHLNPYENGSFSMSYMALKTLFQKHNDREDANPYYTKAFTNFKEFRKTISTRLGTINPYTNNVVAPEDTAYKKGYTRFSQDVIVPAFLAAYTGKDPNTFPLLNSDNSTIRSNPFKSLLPLPNWRINYNGLARLKPFKNIFQSFTLSHSYTGTLSMNSFTSALQYRDDYRLGFPSFLDSTSNNYIPFFLVPNITITENFGPVIGIDATLKNSMNFHVEWKKMRLLSLSLIDFQMLETMSNEIGFGFGMRIRNVKLKTPYFGLNKQKSDVNIKFDFGIRDDKTIIYYLATDNAVASRGQKSISISPSIDYIVNQSLTLRLFMDRRQTIPYVQNIYPASNTKGGLLVRFTLGQ
jgi:cell surface protein SprA